ncbi:DUF1304 domain-containing protein [Weeksellaceae bacterium A-14]|uniref:DUF1304 domain-containing protein n=1 Tax=Daejeonia sp. YH14 TaxID=3439042 RepID=UPI0031E4D3B9
MEIFAKILIAVIAGEHLFILWMEMFSWDKTGKKAFKGALPDDMFIPTKGMAANQGLYNGFLAAGLLWSFFISDPQWSFNISVFFLSCVVVAGLYGAVTASGKIFFVQALPALLALIFLLTSK